MKKLSLIIICILCLGMAFAVTGCKTEPKTTHSFSINKDSVVLEKGDTFRIVASYGNEVLTYSSKNSEIATISETGLITAVNYGETFVVVKASDREMLCKVTVEENNYTVKLNKTGTIYVYVGASFDVSAQLYKNGVAYKDEVTYSVSDKTKCNVINKESGITVKCNAKGEFTLTATSAQGASDTITVKVVESQADLG